MSNTGVSKQPVGKKREQSISLPTEPSVITREEYLKQIDSLFGDGADVLHIECAQIQQVFSWHIHILWQTRLRCSRHGSDMKLQSAPDGLIRVLNMLDLAELFGCRKELSHTVSNDDQSVSRVDRAHLDIAFPATEQGVFEGQRRLVSLLSSLQIPSLTQFELLTVFYEIATNIRMHGMVDKSIPVQCVVDCKEDVVTLTFRDNGIAYDPTFSHTQQGRSQKVVPGRQTNGYGLSLIRKLSDTMKYTRTAIGQNELTIEKYWAPGRQNLHFLFTRPLTDTVLHVKTGSHIDDANTSDLHTLFTNAKQGGYTSIVLDFLDLESISQSGINTIVKAIEMFRASDGDIIFCNVSASTKNTLTSLELVDYLNIVPTQHDAAAACGVR